MDTEYDLQRIAQLVMALHEGMPLQAVAARILPRTEQLEGQTEGGNVEHEVWNLNGPLPPAAHLAHPHYPSLLASSQQAHLSTQRSQRNFEFKAWEPDQELNQAKYKRPRKSRQTRTSRSKVEIMDSVALAPFNDAEAAHTADAEAAAHEENFHKPPGKVAEKPASEGDTDTKLKDSEKLSASLHEQITVSKEIANEETTPEKKENINSQELPAESEKQEIVHEAPHVPSGIKTGVNGASPMPSEAKTESHGTERPHFGTHVTTSGPIPDTLTSLQTHKLQGKANTPAPEQNLGSHPSTPMDLTAVISESSVFDDDVDLEVDSESSSSIVRQNESLFGDPRMQNKRKQLQEADRKVTSECSSSTMRQNESLFGNSGMHSKRKQLEDADQQVASERSSSTMRQNESLFGNPALDIKRKQPEEESKEPEAKRAKTEEHTKTEDARSFEDNLVAMIVGPQRIVIVAEKSKLVEASDFFSKALSGNFKESHTKTMEFSEEEPETINHFVTWLYTGGKSLPGENRKPTHIASIKLYCWAEQIQCKRLQAALFLELYHTMSSHAYPRSGVHLENVMGFIHPFAVRYALTNLPERSPLFDLIIWYFIVFCTDERLAKVKLSNAKYPAEFHSLAWKKLQALGGLQFKKQIPPWQTFADALGLKTRGSQ